MKTRRNKMIKSLFLKQNRITVYSYIIQQSVMLRM